MEGTEQHVALVYNMGRHCVSASGAGHWLGREAWRALLDYQKLLGHLLGRAWLFQVRLSPHLPSFSCTHVHHFIIDKMVDQAVVT